MKNILKREYNKGKHESQIIFHIFCTLLILILRLFLFINFSEEKLGKIKRSEEIVLVLNHKLHNFYHFYQFFHFIIETFKN